ncbi:MAG: ABC transporter permease, partial [Desulfosarcina sp.]
MKATLEHNRLTDGTLMLALKGRWQIGLGAPSGADAHLLLSEPEIRRIGFDSRHLDEWDSSLVVFVSAVVGRCAALNLEVDVDGLPAGARRLLSLSKGTASTADDSTSQRKASLLERLGEVGLRAGRIVVDTFDFIGELALSGIRLVRGKAQFRMAEVLQIVQACGWQALPIVSLISLLVGLILAFMGAVQLRLFGAQIYIADLVGIGMAREMGAVMTGVIMAGRTGAAFAANLGSMQVNEEIDALQTLGVAPMDYLVLPRIFALMLMMPLLCIYADFVGILGGMLVGVGAFDISATQYLNQTRNALSVTHFGIGVAKSVVFG